MEQEAADELGGTQGHRLGAAAIFRVSPTKTNLTLLEPEEAAVGDGHTMRVAGQILQHMFGPAKRRFCVDHPVGSVHSLQPTFKASGIREISEAPAELDSSVGIGFSQRGQKPTSEAAAQDSHGQEKVRAAIDPSRSIQRDPSGWDHTMDMGMEQQVLTPRMKHGEEADMSAKVPRVGGDLQQCLRNGAEQQTIKEVLILKGQLIEPFGNGEDDMAIRNRQ
jgi:hypothetical protein